MKNIFGSVLLIGLLASCDYRHNNEFHQAMVKGNEYKIVKTQSDIALESAVNTYMRDGWVPLGGLAVETDGIYHK